LTIDVKVIFNDSRKFDFVIRAELNSQNVGKILDTSNLALAIVRAGFGKL
jgi:hypothetical protein